MAESGLSSTEAAPGYGWQHVAFGLGVGALVIFLGAGLAHAVSQQGRLPAPSLDAYSEARAHEARGDLRKAIGEYEMALRISVADAQPARRLAEAAVRAGDVAAELRGRREIARLEPRSPAAQAQLGDVLLRAQRAKEAVAAFRRALAGEPRNAAFHNSLGIALAQSGDPRQAIAEFEAAVALVPDPSIQANLQKARQQLALAEPR